MVLLCKTPLKCFEIGFYQWEGFNLLLFNFLWKFARMSKHDLTSVYIDRISKLMNDKQLVEWGDPLFAGLYTHVNP